MKMPLFVRKWLCWSAAALALALMTIFAPPVSAQSSGRRAIFEASPSPPVVTSVIHSGGVRGITVPVGLRGTNLLNKKHQEFIAGDIIERKVIAEVGIKF